MPLSTSSFEGVERASRLRRGSIAVLLLVIAIFLVAFEAATRLVIEHKSKVQREVNVEYAEAIAIQRHRPPAPRQLLVVGNSLVGHGIDMDELRRDLPTDWKAHEFWIYNTNYDDWYFGLRRLFADGSRPDVVAIVFAAIHWNATGTRGDYSAQYLFSTGDIPKVQSQLDLDRTTTASLLFSRFSKAYAIRSEVRKVLLNQLLPDLPRMYGLFKPGPTRHISERQLVDVATRRMLAYKELASRYGTSLVVVVPPLPPPREEHHAALREAAERAGVHIAIPLSGEDIPSSDFSDDVHLTPQGATLFTSALAQVLGAEMNVPVPKIDASRNPVMPARSANYRKSTTE
jgi:hypothetical protein